MTRIGLSSRDGTDGSGADGARRWTLGDLLGGARLRPIWIVAGVLLGLLTAHRAVLLLTKWSLLADHVGWGEIAWCFLLGLRYDAMPIGYALIPLVVILPLLSPDALARRALRKGVVIYTTVAVVLAVGTAVCSVFFFIRFGRRLNYMAFAYLAQRETLLYMWGRYPVWALAPLIAATSWLCYRLFARWFARGGAAAWSPTRRVATAVGLTTLCALACRGGLQSRPLRSGSAYFGPNQLIDQLAMNDFVTMFDAARSELNDGRTAQKTYSLPSVAKATSVARELLYLDGDVPAGHPQNPLWRRSGADRPRRDLNVVLIIMEGMAGRPVGALGHAPSHTPNLDALCREGLFFERMYASGARTSRGMVGVLCSHPDLCGTTLMKSRHAIGRFLTLPEVLAERGYRTMFLYGGRAEFDNMGEFLAAGGIGEILDQDCMPGKPGNWGVPDEEIFRQTLQQLGERRDGPLFAVILTVSNHQPYDVPTGRTEMLPADPDGRNAALNAYRYADWALGEFFRYARRAPWFSETVFVLVADHGRELDQLQIVDVPGFRIPCLLYAPGIVAPGRVATVASQTDIAPTVLGLLGGEVEHGFLGRDLLRVDPDDGFALLHEDVHLAFVRDDLALALSPGAQREPILFHVDANSMTPLAPGDPRMPRRDALKREMLGYYRMALHLYDRGAYCSPRRYAETTTAPTSDPAETDRR